jgi:hypothetical protein
MTRVDSRWARWPVAGILGGLMIAASGTVPSEAYRPDRRPAVELDERLGLSEEQSRAIREVKERNRAARHEIARELRAAQRDLREQVIDGADPARLETQLAAVQEIMGRALRLRLQELAEVAQILTPEQRERLRALRPAPRPVPRAG